MHVHSRDGSRNRQAPLTAVFQGQTHLGQRTRSLGPLPTWGLLIWQLPMLVKCPHIGMGIAHLYSFLFFLLFTLLHTWRSNKAADLRDFFAGELKWLVMERRGRIKEWAVLYHCGALVRTAAAAHWPTHYTHSKTPIPDGWVQEGLALLQVHRSETLHG